MSNSAPNAHMKNHKKRIWVIVVSAIVLVCIAAIVVIQLLRNQEDVPGTGVANIFFSIHDNVLYMDDFIRDEKEKLVLEFDLQNNTFQESSFSRLYNSQDFQDGAILVEEKGVYYNNGSQNKLILKVEEPYFVPKQGIVTDNNHIYIAKVSYEIWFSSPDEDNVIDFFFYDYDIENDTLTEIYHYYVRTNQHHLSSIDIFQIKLLGIDNGELYFALEKQLSNTFYWSINRLHLNTRSASQACTIEFPAFVTDCIYSEGRFITLSHVNNNDENLSLKAYLENGELLDEATIELPDELKNMSSYSTAVLDSKGTVCYTSTDGIYTYSLDNKTASCIYPYDLIHQDLVPSYLYYEDGIMAVALVKYESVKDYSHQTRIIKEIHVINNDQGPFIWRPAE